MGYANLMKSLAISVKLIVETFILLNKLIELFVTAILSPLMAL